jgi:polysaccharide biosynthesis transport protein
MSNLDANTNHQPAQNKASLLPVIVQEPNLVSSPEARPQVVSVNRLPRAPKVKSSGVNALAILKALRRRWLLAATLGSLVAAVIAAGVWFFLPPGKHMAYVKLYMPKKPEGMLYNHPEDVGDFTAFQQTQVALMRGRLVLEKALINKKAAEICLQDAPKGTKDVEWLEKEIRVTTPEGPELPRITMSGDNPEHLKVLLTEVKIAYMTEIVGKQTKRRSDRLDFLKVVRDKYQAELKRIVDARNEHAHEIGTGEERAIALKQELGQKQLALAKTELVKVSGDLRRLELQAETFDAALEKGPREIPEALISASIEKELGKDIALRQQLETRLAETRRVLDNEQHPKIQSLIDKIADHKKALAERREELRSRVKDEVGEKLKIDAKSRLLHLKEQIAFYTELKNLLHEEIEAVDKENHKLNVHALHLESFNAEIKQAEAGVARVMGEIDRLTVEMPTPPRVHADEGVVVVAPDEVSRKLTMAGMGGAGGFGVVLLLIGLLEIRSRRLDSFEEVGQDLGLQLMGTIPAARKRLVLRTSSSNAAQWRIALVESINSVRTMVLRAAKSDSLRVLMVTSATSGEGKTSVSTHLAASLARAGYKTLVLDGDLRKPAAHRVFDLPLEPGFSEILRGEVEWKDAIQPTQVDGLSLISAGECDDEALDLLPRDGIPTLLEQLKAEYDFIVIDSSPVLPVTDSLLIAQHVDGVLLSLFHEVSLLPLVYTACQRLNMVGVRMLGAVINGTHNDPYGYGSRYSKNSSTVLKS